MLSALPCTFAIACAARRSVHLEVCLQTLQTTYYVPVKRTRTIPSFRISSTLCALCAFTRTIESAASSYENTPGWHCLTKATFSCFVILQHDRGTQCQCLSWLRHDIREHMPINRARALTVPAQMGVTFTAHACATANHPVSRQYATPSRILLTALTSHG